jgi:hypothetical protein
MAATGVRTVSRTYDLGVCRQFPDPAPHDADTLPDGAGGPHFLIDAQPRGLAGNFLCGRRTECEVGAAGAGIAHRNFLDTHRRIMPPALIFRHPMPGPRSSL